MAIVVGSDNISDAQWAELGRATRGVPIAELAQTLDMVINDDGILEGDENLHPDWIKLYQRHRKQLEPYSRRFGSDFMEIFDALQPVDQLIDEIDPQKEQIAFLLGAGASKPGPSGIPTVAELLPELLSRARRLDREQVTSLADFCKDRGINNIEDLLTSVHISAFCSRNPNILRLVEFQLFRSESPSRVRRPNTSGYMRTDVSTIAYLQDTLQVLFGLLSSLMLSARPNDGHQAIADYLRNNKSASIITTNYDCCVDRALLSNKMPFSYAIDFTNPDVLPDASDDSATLVKLHGSLNWFYCETCQDVRLIDIEETVDNYEGDRGEYPIISVCKECGGQRRVLLVPPHAMKFDFEPPLQPLIARVRSSFENASLIVVVGFSFADADSYISRMIIKAIQASEVASKGV